MVALVPNSIATQSELERQAALQAASVVPAEATTADAHDADTARVADGRLIARTGGQRTCVVIHSTLPLCWPLDCSEVVSASS